jgi:hypothetical protein
MVASKLVSKFACLVTLFVVLACQQGCAVDSPDEPVVASAQAELVGEPQADEPDETELTSDSDVTLSACWDEYSCSASGDVFGRFCCGIAPGAPGTACSSWTLISRLTCR